MPPRYESRCTAILLLLPPLALRCPIHWARKPPSPNLLSLYEPLPCHVICEKKKEVLAAPSLYLLCAPPNIWHKSNICLPACLPTHPASLTTSLEYVKRGIYWISCNTEHTVVPWAKSMFCTVLFPDCHREDPRHNVRKKILRKKIHRLRFQLACRTHTRECLLKCVWSAFFRS